MKKLPVILFVVLVLLMVGSSPATAQTPEVEEKVSLVLTELENLRLNVIVKDLRLAQQRIQILQRDFQAVLAVVRKAHNAPEAEFIFDPNTMRFVPIPKEPEVKEE